MDISELFEDGRSHKKHYSKKSDYRYHQKDNHFTPEHHHEHYDDNYSRPHNKHGFSGHRSNDFLMRVAQHLKANPRLRLLIIVICLILAILIIGLIVMILPAILSFLERLLSGDLVKSFQNLLKD